MRLNLLERYVATGSLTIHLKGGGMLRAGQGSPEAHIHVHRNAALLHMLVNPATNVGDSYVSGDWDPGEGGLLRVFEVVRGNRKPTPSSALLAWFLRLQSRISEWNDSARARRNVQRHYDLDEELFRSFLDADMHYSCAYFEDPGTSLEEAQRAKCDHVAAKLLLKPGDRVLDIGSGWGGLGLHLAEGFDVHVTGLTLSHNQHRVSQRRAWERGLNGRVEFLLEDYRHHEGKYDAVVSVGMFEHVGRPQYGIFFNRLASLLKPEGRALLHTIGRSGPPTSNNQWVQRNIFPGAYIPALSEVLYPVEFSGLVLADCEVLRTHYALTLHHWHERFQVARARLADRLGERLCRKWEFYLQACEAMFRWGNLVVFQLQLAHDKDAIPLTRDYLYAPLADPKSVVRRRTAVGNRNS